MSSIESIVDQLKIKQAKGIFAVPSSLFGNRSFGLLKKQVQNTGQIPLIVQEAPYYRNGLETKLHVSRPFVKKLVGYGLLRPLEGEHFHHWYSSGREKVQPLSVAQLMSWLFQHPIEDLLLSEAVFSQAPFLKKTSVERVTILYNAYSGCHWFELFKTRLKKHFPSPPSFSSEDVITRPILSSWYFGSYDKTGTLKKLCDVGLVLPASGEFVGKSLKNVVHQEALATLLSLVYDVPLKEICLQGDKTPELDALVDSFYEQKLLPYFFSTSIHPLKKYSFSDAAQRSALAFANLYYAVRRGAVKHTTFEENRKTKVQGVDVALFHLRGGRTSNFTLNEVKKLFGVRSFPYRVFGFKRSKNKTFSRHHYVFPLYDQVAEKARGKLLTDLSSRENAYILSFEGIIKYITLSAQIDFCHCCDLSQFTREEITLLNEQTKGRYRIGENTIQTEDFILTYTDWFITGIKKKIMSENT